MRKPNLAKIESKLLKAQHKAHKKQFNKVRKKLRAVKGLKHTDFKVLEKDLKEVNGDLLDVLFYCPAFTSVDDYLDTINAYLLSETESYDYGKDKDGKKVRLAYLPSKMKMLMNIVRATHNRLNRYEELKTKIGL